MKKQAYILFLLICFSALGLNAQEMNAVITADKDSILIGDQVNVNIQITTNKQTKIGWPKLEGFIAPKVEILKRSAVDSILVSEEEIVLEQNLLITSFDTGSYEIPGIVFAYTSDTSQQFLTDTSNNLSLNVYTVEVDTTQAIKPIKGPISQPYTFAEIAPWAILGLIIIGMVIFLIYYFRRKSDKQPIFKIKSKPKIPAHIVALGDLDNLKSKKLWQDGRFKEYYTELIDIVRVYLGDQFCIDAMEMTSDEIIEIVAKEPKINEEIRKKLAETLMVSDLVKFAKEQPLANVNDNSLENLVEFVNTTQKTIEAEELKSPKEIADKDA